MQIIGIIVAVIALMISVVTAIIAGRALREHVRIAKITANYTAITVADSLLVKNPGLLAFYNIDGEMLQECGIEPLELVYLAESFHAAELYHRLDGTKPIVISGYRKNMLKNAKVRTAWKHFIKNKFSFYEPFTEAVDEAIRNEAHS